MPRKSLPTPSMETSRRGLLGLMVLAPLAPAATRAAPVRTPPATEGPFYPSPSMRFTDADNDLVKITDGRRERAKGEVVVLRGRVLDRSGKPAVGARVEIWQCDVNGRYRHTRDFSVTRRRDSGFQGFGYVVTGDDGIYAFRTIRPVSYPGRTPHIHVKVIHRDVSLTTQLYIDGHEKNLKDQLFRRLTAEQQQAVSMRFLPGSSGLEANVNIQL